MSIRELDTVVLDRDLPEHGLRRGDIGAVVHVYDREAVEVEFVRLSGQTQALVRLDFAARCPIGIVERVGDELFFGNVNHELALTSGASSRRILSRVR